MPLLFVAPCFAENSIFTNANEIIVRRVCTRVSKRLLLHFVCRYHRWNYRIVIDVTVAVALCVCLAMLLRVNDANSNQQ